MDLLLKHEISFKESILGFSFIIEHLNLKNIKFKNSRNKIITNKTSKVIKQLGFIRGENQGDLILEFHVTTPDAFSEEQLKMIEECF
jgi:DnaJ-class molecular chaperone